MDFQHKLAFENRECEICKKNIHINKRITQRFCSPQCQGKWQTIMNSKKTVILLKEAIVCEMCGKTFNKHTCKIRSGKHNFCCVPCSRKWYSTVFSQSSEWRDESRKRAVKILEDGLIPSSLSSAQVAVNNLLQEYSIEYQNEYNCKYFAIDNYLPQYNLMIEVMGDFWHTNPIKYSVIKYKNQASSIKRDKAKRTYIKNQYGINILYLWEDDINKRADLCLALIELYIKMNGILQNYHSFNYQLYNNEVLLNLDIIHPYFEMDVEEYRKLIKIA